MERLSRTEKYKEYRNEINNTGEKRIATKELKELQDKLIINEKRFGNNSRTESDFNRGIKGSTLDDLYNIFGTSNNESENTVPQSKKITQETSFDTLDDIFNEIDKIDVPSNHDALAEEKDDYIQKIKEIVLKDYREEPVQQLNRSIIEDDDDLVENIELEETVTDVDEQNEPLSEITSEHLEMSEEGTTPLKDDVAEFEETERNIDVDQDSTNDTFEKNDVIEPQSLQDKPYSSSLQNVAIEDPVINIITPKEDTSKEFVEVCENVNRLAAAVEENNTVLKENNIHEKSITKSSPVDLLQNNSKKEMLNDVNKHSFMDNLENELNRFNQMNVNITDDNNTNELAGEQSNSVEQEESIENVTLKKEFENTVSIEASKLRDEINSIKTDHISADSVINVNHLLKDNSKSDIQEGKTIAFNLGKEEASYTPEVPDNTVIIDKHSVGDTSIHTMSFKKEDLELENDEKSNTFLNIVLIFLIIFAVIVLCAIVYFFLITRGIL